MTKLQKPLSFQWNNWYCRLKPSPLDGVGVFCIRFIPKNTVLFDYPTETYDLIPLDSIEDDNVRRLYSDLFVQEEGYIWVPRSGMRGVDMSYYLNHSKNPNIHYDEHYNYFVALRDIKVDEELTYNYNSLGREQR